MEFVTTPLFLSLSLSFIRSSIKSMSSSTSMTYPGRLYSPWICSWGEPTCKEVGGFGRSPHGELSDVPLCSVFSHHVGQVHSAHHFGMLPFPGLSFQEPHRDGQGFCTWLTSVQFSSVTQSCPTLCDPKDLSHPRLPWRSPSPGAYWNSGPMSQWCHLTISSSVTYPPVPLIFPSIRVFSNESVLHIMWSDIGVSASASASVLLLNIQDWYPLGLTDLISL